MSKNLLRTALLLLVAGLCAESFAEVDLIVDVRPGTLVLSSETGDFEVLGPAPEPLGINEVEEGGELTALPNVKLGLGITEDDYFLDVTGQLGILINERFRALALGGDVSWEYRYRKNVALGPHIGLVYFQDPEWTGDAKLDMDDTWGILGGFQMSIGYDVLFVFTVDYLFADPFELTVTDPRWIPSDDEIDIEGLAVQFGIRGRI